MSSINVLASTLSLQAVASKREGGLGPQLTYMKLIIEQLDGRHKGTGHWTHRVQFVRDGYGHAAREAVTKDWVGTRILLWETFGPGCDREELYSIIRSTLDAPDWGWWTDTRGTVPYIYFKRGPILTWFLMRT